MLSLTQAFKSLALAAALLAPSMADAASSRLIAQCSGSGYTARVREFAGQGNALYVYSGSRLLLSRWATKSISPSLGGLQITQFSAGSPLQGGADLRIRSRADRNPDTEGYAHLTYAGSNSLMTCAVYQ